MKESWMPVTMAGNEAGMIIRRSIRRAKNSAPCPPPDISPRHSEKPFIGAHRRGHEGRHRDKYHFGHVAAAAPCRQERNPGENRNLAKGVKAGSIIRSTSGERPRNAPNTRPEGDADSGALEQTHGAGTASRSADRAGLGGPRMACQTALSGEEPGDRSGPWLSAGP